MKPFLFNIFGKTKQLEQEIMDLKARNVLLQTNLEHSQAYTNILADEKKHLQEEVERLNEEIEHARVTEQEERFEADELRGRLISVETENDELRARKRFNVMTELGNYIRLDTLVQDDIFDDITVFVASYKSNKVQWKPAYMLESIGGEILLGDAEALKQFKIKSASKPKRKGTNSRGPM